MTPATMTQLRYGYFPKEFTANGVKYTVQQVERCWTVGEQKATHMGFRVRCESGETLNLFRDVKTDAWTVEQ